MECVKNVRIWKKFVSFRFFFWLLCMIVFTFKLMESFRERENELAFGGSGERVICRPKPAAKRRAGTLATKTLGKISSCHIPEILVRRNYTTKFCGNLFRLDSTNRIWKTSSRRA